MVTTYYTDEMKQAFRSCDNTLNFPIELTQMEDDSGPYLCLKFKRSDYEGYNDDRAMLTVVANDLVNMRNALKAQGARVTFLVEDDS